MGNFIEYELLNLNDSYCYLKTAHIKQQIIESKLIELLIASGIVLPIFEKEFICIPDAFKNWLGY